jgi:hypothetical protein
MIANWLLRAIGQIGPNLLSKVPPHSQPNQVDHLQRSEILEASDTGLLQTPHRLKPDGWHVGRPASPNVVENRSKRRTILETMKERYIDSHTGLESWSGGETRAISARRRRTS